ncbi:MAG: polymerase III, delta subunit HolA protein [Candidatus Moranbacteria bacterium GW2011_GWF2_34_56]|nr:MAG: polymerase III, delta subunit HolA protein [Candidatus Moranbacteria bacterium GW2011_GWF2_34_56]
MSREGLNSREEIIKFLENKFKNIDYSEDVIVFWEGGKIKKNDKIFKWLIKNSQSQEFNKLEGLLLKKWVQEKFLNFNIKVSEEISGSLINNKNGDLSAIDKEILKIVNFIGENGSDEDLSDQVAKLINSSVEANIFQTVELMSSGNKKQALEMLHRQLEQGDDPFYILSMYIYQIRNLLKIAEFYFQGNFSHLDISKIVKLHPFVVQKGTQQLRNLDFNKLREIYKKLEKIDEDAKRGKRDIGIGMELLISEM